MQSHFQKQYVINEDSHDDNVGVNHTNVHSVIQLALSKAKDIMKSYKCVVCSSYVGIV